MNETPPKPTASGADSGSAQGPKTAASASPARSDSGAATAGKPGAGASARSTGKSGTSTAGATDAKVTSTGTSTTSATGTGAAGKGAAAGQGPGSPNPVPAGGPASGRRSSGRVALVLALLALLVAVAGNLALWQWTQKNTRELARRVQAADVGAGKASQEAVQAADLVRELRTRTESVEARLAEAAGQQAQLEKLYRSVALDGVDAVLAELESMLALAAQQLASGGSAEAAILALQTADGRLDRLDDPSLVAIRQAIARDTDRLRSASGGDIGVLAARLDNLARAVDDWPLAAEALAAAPARAAGAAADEAEQPPAAGTATPTRPDDAQASAAEAGEAGEAQASGRDSTADEAPGVDQAAASGGSADHASGAVAPATTAAREAPPAAAAQEHQADEASGSALAGLADRLGRLVNFERMSEEVSRLFRVRRIDSPDVALIAPDQVYFLRENLRLRLLNARLALLSRNDPLFRSDIEQARNWIEHYFDPGSALVERALVQLEQLARARTVGDAPSVSDSLAAVRAARALRESRQ